MKKRCLVCLLALILCLLPTAARAEGKQKAKELTKWCAIDFGPYSKAEGKLLNWDIRSRVAFSPDAIVTAAWDDDHPAAYLCLQWFLLPEGVTVRQFDGAGALLEESLLERLPESVIPLAEQARAVSIAAGEGGMEMSQLHVFGAGILPEPYHLWQQTPEHLDYLIISTHPDDDVLYMGSVVPIVGAERGYVGTIVYATCRTRTRMTEAENGAWAMGLRYRPIFWGFSDIARDASPQKKSQFSYDDLLQTTVRTYRQYHPVVVFAQDRKGEYGHWQHKLTSQAAVEAFDLAADPDYDPESRDLYGLWQVQKVYLHLYPENVLLLDANVPLEAFGGTTAFDVARKAYLKHKSQQTIGYAVEKDGQRLAFNRFGMVQGVVEPGDDVFANVPETLLSTYTPPPTPTPAPTPEPTPTPGPTVTPEPPSTPTAEPTPSPTLTIAPTAEPVSEETVPKEAGGFLWKVLGVALAAGALAAALVLMGRRKSNKPLSQD